MDGTAKSPFGSAEEAGFARYYEHLLRDVSRPVKLAELLFFEGIVTSETKESIISNEDQGQKRALLDAIQISLACSRNANKVMKILCKALEKVGVNTYYMQDFIAGEQS